MNKHRIIFYLFFIIKSVTNAIYYPSVHPAIHLFILVVVLLLDKLQLMSKTFQELPSAEGRCWAQGETLLPTSND